MKEKKNFQVSELFLIMADLKRTFTGIITRDITEDNTPICRGTVIVNEGKMVSSAKTEKELTFNLDTMCKMKLDYGLHKKDGIVNDNKLIGNAYFLN